MELTFVGADHEVTGSCHYLHAAGKNILIDYGMEQGGNVFENIPLPVKPAEVDYVFLTHAHIDHSGMLPKLYADGFRGEILCTPATKDLCEIMLLDSAHIQMQEAEYNTKRAAKRGREEKYEPVYTMESATEVLRLFHEYGYNRIYDLCEGVRFRFTDVGHLLGSASIELWLREAPAGERREAETADRTLSKGFEGTDSASIAGGIDAADDGVSRDLYTRKIVFSGDIGNKNQPLLRDPIPTRSADYVVMESTYGDRLHEQTGGNWVPQLAEAIGTTLKRGGNLVIPAFAVGRTQVILYFIRQIKEQKMLPELPDFPVYVDSPMAVRATSVFEDNEIECFDEDAMALVRQGINPLQFPNLHLTITTEESREINYDDTPKVIISSSGMCDAGRIKHHIKNNISNPKSTILFVGYQAQGTLGRRLTDGAKEVKIFGETYQVRADIQVMDGLSGHADKNGLLEWVSGFEEKPQQIFVVHGDDEAASSFADCLQMDHGYKAMAPFSGTKYDLFNGRFIRIAKGVPVKGGVTRSVSDSYTKLQIANRRLQGVIDAARGLPNKELAEFTREVNDLCRKYQIG